MWPNRSRLLANGDDECIDAQSHWQLCSGIEFDQNLQELPIDALGRLVGASSLGTKQFANLNHVSPYFLLAGGIVDRAKAR